MSAVWWGMRPLPVLALPLLVCAAPAHAQRAWVERAVLATALVDNRPDGSVRRIDPSERVVHCCVAVDGIAAPTKVRAVLVAVDAAGYRDRKILEQGAALDPKRLPPEPGRTSRRADVRFTFTMPRDWPPGRYRVDVLVGEKTVEALDLTVRAPRR